MAALLFISFIVLLLIGVPVAFAIAAAALLVLLKGDVKLLILVQRMFASTDSFSLIAVPFFIFAGDLLAKGKVSKVLVEFAESLLGMLKGGLSIVSVLIPSVSSSKIFKALGPIIFSSRNCLSYCSLLG